eukprot:TRINITY_DN5255_c0_g2_i2.p1 TRINITY_DN5255_c0_g2~~TRINITY_DN5255_c0_g2_i2.p1  ORF type:complete len:519 (-),score=177.15 TRINITY_DN5255_c0_g2_i2:184-1740(-)
MNAFDERVMWKVDKMKAKTESIRDVFGVPDTEYVIQDYRCSYRKIDTNNKQQSVSGKMYITQNYVLFEGKKGITKEAIAFYRIQGASRSKHYGLGTAIEIDTESGLYFFTSFLHREEAFFLIQYLLQYQPTYASITDAQVDVSDNNNNENEVDKELDYTFKELGLEGLDIEEEKEEEEDNGRWSTFIDTVGNATVDDYEKVDLDTTKKAVQIAKDIREVNAYTIENLEKQDEILDNIYHNTKETKNNIERSDRVIDGISSWTGQVKNAVTPDLYKNGVKRKDNDNKIKVKANIYFTDIPILIKHPSDSFEPAVLRFADDNLYCVDLIAGKKIKPYIYDYDKIRSIVIRARHQHLDIRFNDNKDRFRCMSSFVQGITNEVILRTRSSQVSVIFEPGTKQFQYGSLELRGQSTCGSRTNDISKGFSSSSKNGFYTLQQNKQNVKTSQILNRAPEEVIADLDENDEDIDILIDVLADVKNSTNAINVSLEDSNKKIDKTLKNVHKARDKLHKDNYRAKRLN